jgi:hypothetical protein
VLRRFTTQRTLIVVLFILIFAMAARIERDPDTYWHIASGQLVLETGQPIREDPFSFTFNGVYRVGHEWLAQVVLAQVWAAGGQSGLTLYTAVLATVGLIGLYFACAGSPYLRAFVLVAAATVAAAFWAARPQMFTFVFSAAFLAVTLPYQRGVRRRLWILPVMMLVWAQMHAGWAIGFMILGAGVAGEAMRWVFQVSQRADAFVKGRALALTGLACAAVLIVNPYGFDLLRVPFETLSVGPLTRFIAEWLPPDPALRETWPFFAVLALTLLMMLLGRKHGTPTEWILLALSGFLALRAARNIAFFAVVAAPILSVQIDGFLARRNWAIPPPKRVSIPAALLNATLILLALLVGLVRWVQVSDPRETQRYLAQQFPLIGVEVLNASGAPREMFHDFEWGGYLILNAPEYPVFIDGRTDLYGDFLLEYLNITQGTNWREAFAQYGIQVVLAANRWPLTAELRREPGWVLRYEDGISALFVWEGLCCDLG